MDKPFFSVVIPTFDRYAMVSRAIQSVLSQTFEDFELIVVDDHSTNYGEAAFSEFQDARLTVVQNRRSKGACGARNTGLHIARAEWVAFLDDDDEWTPDKLSLDHRCISSLPPNSNVALIHSNAVARDGPKKNVKRLATEAYFPDRKRNLLYVNSVGGMSVVTGRVSALLAAGGFDETLPAMQDLDLFVRLAAHGEFSHIPKISTFTHVSHDDRITRNAEHKFAATQAIQAKYQAEIESSFRLRYVYGSRAYRYSVRGAQWKRALMMCPWFLAGIVLDPLRFRQDLAVTAQVLTKRCAPRWSSAGGS